MKTFIVKRSEPKEPKVIRLPQDATAWDLIGSVYSRLSTSAELAKWHAAAFGKEENFTEAKKAAESLGFAFIPAAPKHVTLWDRAKLE